jgi:hypothetical protein
MVATGAAVGSLYAVIQAPPDFDWLVEVATGGTIGSIISSCVLGFELFGASWLFERGGRRVPLLGAMLTRYGHLHCSHHVGPYAHSLAVFR